VNLRVRVTAFAGTSIINNASVTPDPALGSSATTDPTTVNNAASTPATSVGTSLPATGWSMIQRWLQGATWAFGLGALIVVIARRRRAALNGS
jgi:hypothetical protein